MQIKQRKLPSFERVRKDESATVLIEFAAGLPFFLFMAFASLELMNYIIVHSSISTMALSVADNSSRTLANVTTPVNISEKQINDVLNGATLSSGVSDFATQGNIILSSLEAESRPDGDPIQKIAWQRCYRKPGRSSYGDVGPLPSTPTTSEGMGPPNKKIKAMVSTGVMFVEVQYQYRPRIFGPWMSTALKTITYTAAYMVRDPRDYSSVTNTEGVPKKLCA